MLTVSLKRGERPGCLFTIQLGCGNTMILTARRVLAFTLFFVSGPAICALAQEPTITKAWQPDPSLRMPLPIRASRRQCPMHLRCGKHTGAAAADQTDSRHHSKFSCGEYRREASSADGEGQVCNRFARFIRLFLGTHSRHARWFFDGHESHTGVRPGRRRLWRATSGTPLSIKPAKTTWWSLWFR